LSDDALNQAINDANANDPEYQAGVDKLAFVREQMASMWRNGTEKELSCPYCMSVVTVGESPCCDTLWRAVNAILEAQEVVDKLEKAKRIHELSGGRYRN
jgi:hypothetical protein